MRTSLFYLFFLFEKRVAEMDIKNWVPPDPKGVDQQLEGNQLLGDDSQMLNTLFFCIYTEYKKYQKCLRIPKKYFTQHLSVLAPKSWSKYTSPVVTNFNRTHTFKLFIVSENNVYNFARIAISIRSKTLI